MKKSLIEKILDLYNLGMKPVSIAEYLGVSQMCVEWTVRQEEKKHEKGEEE